MPLPSSKKIIRTKLLATLDEKQRAWFDQLEKVWAMDLDAAKAANQAVEGEDLTVYIQRLKVNVLKGMAEGLGPQQIADMWATAKDKGGFTAVASAFSSLEKMEEMQRAQETDDTKRGITALIIEPFDDELAQLAERFCASCRTLCGLTPKPKEIAA